MNDFEVVSFKKDGSRHAKRYTTADLNYCVKVTMGKIKSFEKKYGHKPIFVKVPVWFTGFVCVLDDNIAEREITEFCGLLICETPSIDSLDKIEVF